MGDKLSSYKWQTEVNAPPTSLYHSPCIKVSFSIKALSLEEARNKIIN